MTPKRLLYVSHRWLGVAMCLFLAMWCVSGVVMMYVGFPELTQDEYYAGLEPLAADRIAVGPEEPLTMVDSGVNVEQLLLTSSGERPVYLLKAAGAAWQGMHADTGARIRQMPADAVVASAVHFYKAQHPEYEAQHPEQTAVGEYLEQLHMDQWSVSDGLHPYRPLHRVAIDDGLGTELYLSSLTGQVVRDTRRSERIWNWLGANLHWIYPVQLRKHRSTWENVIIVLALAGLVSVITGAIIGFTRLRLKRRYPDGSRSPYRGMTKYHHVIGLAGLVFLLTFLFSGLLALDWRQVPCLLAWLRAGSSAPARCGGDGVAGAENRGPCSQADSGQQHLGLATTGQLRPLLLFPPQQRPPTASAAGQV